MNIIKIYADKGIKIPLIILFIILIQGFSYCDSTTSLKFGKPKKTTIWQDIGYDLKYFAVDWGNYFAEPFRNSKNLIYCGSVAGITALSSTVDKDVRKSISVQGNNTYNQNFLDGPSAYGYVQYPSIFAGVLYSIGLITRENELRKTGRMLIQSLVYSGTLTMGLRYLFGRARPFSSKTGSQYEFTWFQSKGDTQSFPSGHTVVAFATSTILAEQIDTWWARVILYPFAALTAYARVRNDMHWLSDVIFAGALGYGTSKFIIAQERNREKAEKRKMNKGGGLSFYPSFNGFSIQYKF
jgi:membrane-associated phospholipid phosphatase